MIQTAALADQGYFSLFDLAAWPKLYDLLGLTNDNQQNQEFLTEVLAHQIGLIKEDKLPFTGMVADGQVGWPVVLQQQLDLPTALALHRSQAEYDPLSLPPLVKNWTVQEIAGNLTPLYLVLFYNPQEEGALKKKQFLAEIADYAHHEGVEVILDLRVFSLAEKQAAWEEFREWQLTAVSELQGWVDLLVLQHPRDSLACATLTAQLDKPWLLGDDNYQYAEFKEAVRDSLENGAMGFVAGESLWSSLADLRAGHQLLTTQQLMDFDVALWRDQILELTRIVREFAN